MLQCDCCSYDPREDKWSVLAEMGTARALAGCTVYRNKIYVIGIAYSLHSLLLNNEFDNSCLIMIDYNLFH